MKLKLRYWIFAAVFSVFQTIGMCLYNYGRLDFEENTYGWIRYPGVFVCSYLLCLIFLFWFVYVMTNESNEYKENKIKKMLTKRMINAGIILLGWIPWLAAFYPGSLFYDMTHQLAQYYGIYSIQTHPPFSTLVMGICVDTGKALFHNDNSGLFIYVVLQTLICAAACTEVIAVLDDMGISFRLHILILVFYAFFPLYGANAQFATKDVMNYGFTTLAAVQIIRIFRKICSKQLPDKKYVVAYTAFCFLSCLYRKEMIYIYIVTSLAVLGISVIKSKSKLSFVYMAVVLVCIILSDFVTTEVISKGYLGQEFRQGDTESLSIPLQQVARFVKYHGEDISDSEKEIIGQCFFYGYDEIASNYNPNLSDPIKYNFNRELSKQNGFWTVYLKLFLRNPFVYFESILASSYGYFSIVPNVPTTIDNAPTNGLPGGRVPSTYIELGPIQEAGIFHVSYRDDRQTARLLLKGWLYIFELAYNPLYSFGFYSWAILLMCLLVVFRKGWTYCVPFLLAILLIMVCIASPVNDYGRYYMSVIYIFPLLAGYTRVCYTQDDFSFHGMQ